MISNTAAFLLFLGFCVLAMAINNGLNNIAKVLLILINKHENDD